MQIDAAMLAMGTFVAIVVAAGDAVDASVNLRQMRALIILSAQGPLNLAGLAERLVIHPSSATRLCDGLVKARLVRRQQARHDRRHIELTVTTKGQRIVDMAVAQRRALLGAIITDMSPADRSRMSSGFRAFAEAGNVGSVAIWPPGGIDSGPMIDSGPTGISPMQATSSPGRRSSS